MLADLRFALRGLRATPLFTTLAVLTLALGIGANAAIFTLVDNIFLKGLDFEQPDRVYRLSSEAPERGANQFPWSEAKFRFFRERQAAFSEFAADAFAGYTLTGLGEPELLNGQRITSNLFPLLGIQPIQGRLFREDEEEFGPNVAIISESFWTSRLGRDSSVVGRTVSLDDEPYEIVGVIADQPATVFGPVELWTTRPFMFPGYTDALRERGVGFLRVWGRVKEGISEDQARVQVKDLTAQYAQQFASKVDAPLVTAMQSLADEAVGDLRGAFWMLVGAVVLVLLIASSNVANLLLVRFASRKREVAVRLALGSARRQVIRLFLLESVSVSVLAILAGAIIGQFVLRAFSALLTGVPVTGELTLNPGVLAATACVGLLAGVLTGAYPAFQSARADVVDAIKEGSRSSTSSLSQHYFRMALVAGQVALSSVLLVGALLLLSSFEKLKAVDLGFEPDGLLVATVNLPSARYDTPEKQAVMVDRFIELLRNRHGIEAATAAAGLPMTGFAVQGPFTRADPELPYNERPIGFFRYVGDDYFQTIGARLREGRTFNGSNFANPDRVVLISERLSSTVFPSESAVGRFLVVGSIGGGERVEVLGVVADMQSVSVNQPPVPEVYRPFSQRLAAGGFFQFAVRSASGDGLGTLPTVRAVLTELDPNLPLIQPDSMTNVVGGTIAQQQLLLALLASFAVLAVLLAVVGLYSVLAFLAGQRTPEIGVRLALGAQRTQVTGLIWRQGMTPVVVGVAIGLVTAAFLGRLVESQLYGTAPTDVAAYTISSTSLLGAAALACVIPAWRASRMALGRIAR